MGFQFAEMMSGTIEWDAAPGVTHPFKFEVTAHADSTRAHLRDGKAILRGTISAPPRADAVDLEGVITIRPLGQKIIRYELSFIGDDGKAYELVGQKDIRWRHPLRTFTYLRGDPGRGPPTRGGVQDQLRHPAHLELPPEFPPDLNSNPGRSSAQRCAGPCCPFTDVAWLHAVRCCNPHERGGGAQPGSCAKTPTA